MSRSMKIVTSIPAMLLAAAPALAQSPAGQLPGWMAGSWYMEDGASWADELWSPPRGGMMLGAGRTGFGPQLQDWESVRIVQKPNGAISYHVQSRGGPSIEFPMVTISADAIEFANPGNAYPQRIRYWRQGQLLMAETAKLDGSEVVRWNYRPVEQ